MCQSRLFHYDLSANLTNWLVTYVLNAALTYIAFDIDDQALIWVSAVFTGILAMWALEMGREWLKVNLKHPIL